MTQRILIILGSDSDLPKLQGLLDRLDAFAIRYDLRICSAHRSPDLALDLAQSAEAEGYQLIIAAAGLAAHLPGVLAASTLLPVIGVPMTAGALQGMDALLSVVQMPPGIPVATVGIDAGSNAAVLAARILALADSKLREKLKDYRQELLDRVIAKDQAVQERLRGAK